MKKSVVQGDKEVASQGHETGWAGAQGARLLTVCQWSTLEPQQEDVAESSRNLPHCQDCRWGTCL